LEEYKNYGARGIKVCSEWKYDFLEFLKWAQASGYKNNLTVDRINNEKNYSPDNCQWISLQAQQTVEKKLENKGYIFIEHKGKDYHLKVGQFY
jgi:hemin uptake protein HemP